MSSMLKRTFIMAVYFRNDLLPCPCLYLAFFALHILGEHPLLKQPFSLGFCECVVPYWAFEHPPHLPSSLDWISGAFHVHWDFFYDMRLCSFVVFFFELHYQEGYFCLPCNLINAGWWKIRREQTSTGGSGWVHQDSSLFIPSFLHFWHKDHTYFSRKFLGQHSINLY